MASDLKLLKPSLPVLNLAVVKTVPVSNPDSWRTGLRSAAARGYDRRWQRYRKDWLRRHPICGDRLNTSSPQHSLCLQQGMATPASQVDHIKDHQGNTDLFWDQANLQSLCHTCHSTKTSATPKAGGES